MEKLGLTMEIRGADRVFQAGAAAREAKVTTVLVVEDEQQLRVILRAYLERAGFTVLTAGRGTDALALTAAGGVDLLILDLGLPDVPGDEVLREIRATSAIPVLLLTGRADVQDRINGLEIGADDYVTKPFSPREVVLRVQAILHRVTRGSATDGVRSFGQGTLVIDEPRHSVSAGGADKTLTPTEWGILLALAGVPGRVYTRFELINRVRGYEFDGYERTIDSHIKNLRRKLEADPRHPTIVATVLGVGYRLGISRDD